jgi:Dyp-type peroxidase family
MVEVGQVQGNVLHAYGTKFPYARYVLLRFKNGDQMREALSRWHDRVTFGRPQDLRPRVNVAITYAGLEKLLKDKDLLRSFPEDFRQGAYARSKQVGDVGASRADTWWDGTHPEHHALVSVHATHSVACTNLVNRFTAGCDVRWDTAAALLPGGADGYRQSCGTEFHREHFGFADGCSQPAVEGVDDDPVGDGLYARRPLTWWRGLQWLELLTEDLGLRHVPRRWRPVRTGEFLLGYENEDGRHPDGPPAPLGPNGTFMVYRELDQNVRAFEKFVHDKAGGLEQEARERAEQERNGDDTSPEVDYNNLIRAKIVGRWPDGTPLALSPDSPNPAIATDRRRANNFLYRADRDGYRADLDGVRCPLGAHVRRTNPRDALPGGAERTMRHRIIRRGMPYGPPYEASKDDGERRGLAFVCFSSSIANGFEFIQRGWCNDGGAFGLGADQDFLLRQDATTMVIPARDDGTVVLDAPAEPFVTVRGCEYLFLPSRRAYEWLMSARR